MKIEVLVVSPFQQNARILICEATNKAVLVDPGDEAERILKRAKDLGVELEYILATHGHIDHVGAVAAIQKRTDLPFYIHQEDQLFLDNLPLQGMQCGLFGLQVPTVTRYIEEGETFRFGQCQGEVLFVPGHSPGHVAFLFGKDLIGGDVLFHRGIGRTDLPKGSFEVLGKSIQEKFYTLPDETIVHTGHGPNTTIGEEKRYNPFVRASGE